MLEDDHSKDCCNFIAKKAQILKGVLNWGDILLLKKIVKSLPQLSWEYMGFRTCSP